MTQSEGRACIYCKESLPVRVISIPFLKKAVLLELVQNNKKIFASLVYRSPSQINDRFNHFLWNFEKILLDINHRKPYLTSVTGNFNARSYSWWSDDINTPEGTQLLLLTSCNAFQQIINEPTHAQRQSSSCIDLIFMDQPSLSFNSEIHTSLHVNCHHQIVQSKFDLNISYPPPYQRLLWDYKETDVSSIRKALDLVNWENFFHNKNIDIKSQLFSETILNIFSNFAPNKIITCNDKDPIWMNEKIKS